MSSQNNINSTNNQMKIQVIKDDNLLSEGEEIKIGNIVNLANI